jgi:hypothetical protein
LKTLQTYGLSGYAALEDLIGASPYKSVEQIVASLTLFSHADTVRQTRCKPLFRVVRNAAKRGTVEEGQGGWIAYDDNKSPTDAFLWCNGLSASKMRDVQFNHLYADSQNADQYTCLANLCVTPAFLAKLTDTKASVRSLLRFRAYDLYGWVPAGHEAPTEPAGYADLIWAPPLPPVSDVEAQARLIMERKPKDRTVQIASRIGWLYNDYTPSSELMRSRVLRDEKIRS